MCNPSSKTKNDRAVELSTAEELDAAIDQLQKQLTMDCENGRRWELLGVFAYYRDNFALAQSATEEASARVPLSARSQLILAKCYDRSGHIESAAAIYRHVAQVPDLDADLLELLASGLGRHAMYEVALNVCRQAARRMPDSADPLLGIAHYMRRLRRPTESILPTLFQALFLEPDNVECRIVLAWMLHEVGRSQESAYLLEVVDRESFACIGCLRLIEIVFEKVGDYERASQCRARQEALMSTSSNLFHREGFDE